MVSAIGLKFDGAMHSAIRQITIQNGHAWPIFSHSTEPRFCLNFTHVGRPLLAM